MRIRAIGIIDGGESVGFLLAVKEALENPIELLMDNDPKKVLELNGIEINKKIPLSNKRDFLFVNILRRNDLRLC